MDWRDRYGPWAVVTGASSGLGAEYARQLAAIGLDLWLVARRGDRLEGLAGELRDAHRIRAEILVADLLADSDRAAVEALATDHEIGLLVNNAGVSYSGRFLDADAETCRRMTRLNCEVPALLARAFLAPMVGRGRGGMVLLASMSSFQATPYQTLYGATKAYDLLLGEGLAVELADSGVTLQTVCPGSTYTELQEIAGVPSEFRERRLDPADVVRGSLRTFGRRQTYVPALRDRLLLFAQRFGPRSAAARVAGRMLERRLR